MMLGSCSSPENPVGCMQRTSRIAEEVACPNERAYGNQKVCSSGQAVQLVNHRKAELAVLSQKGVGGRIPSLVRELPPFLTQLIDWVRPTQWTNSSLL